MPGREPHGKYVLLRPSPRQPAYGWTAGSALRGSPARGVTYHAPMRRGTGDSLRVAHDRTTLALYAALGVFGCLQVVPGLVGPSLRTELGYDYTTASLHATAFAVLGIIAGLGAPSLDLRFSRRSVLLLGLLGMAGSTAWLTAGRQAAATLAAAGGAGLFGTLVLFSVQSALADKHGEGRVVAFAESNTVASAGATLAPLVVGGAAQLGSWRWGVLGLALVGLAVCVPSASARLHRQRALNDDSRLGGSLPTGARIGVALVFLGVLLELSVTYWGSTYLREVVGLNPAAAVTGMSSFFAAILISRVAVGAIVRRVGSARLLAVGLALVGAGLTLNAASTAAPAALTGLVLLGVGLAALFPLALGLAIAAAPDRAAVISGRCVVAGSTAVAIGPLLVGQLADVVGLRAALAVLPLAAAAAVPLLLHVRRNQT